MEPPPLANITNLAFEPHGPVAPPIVETAEDATLERACEYKRFEKSLFAFSGIVPQTY